MWPGFKEPAFHKSGFDESGFDPHFVEFWPHLRADPRRFPGELRTIQSTGGRIGCPIGHSSCPPAGRVGDGAHRSAARTHRGGATAPPSRCARSRLHGWRHGDHARLCRRCGQEPDGTSAARRIGPAAQSGHRAAARAALPLSHTDAYGHPSGSPRARGRCRGRGLANRAALHANTRPRREAERAHDLVTHDLVTRDLVTRDLEIGVSLSRLGIASAI